MIFEIDLQVLKSMKEKMKNRIKERNAITSNELNGEANREICSTEILIELHDQVRINSISHLKIKKCHFDLKFN